MKHAITVEYAEGGIVTYFAESKQSADDFAERVFESGPQALSAVVRPATSDESAPLQDDEPTGDAQCDLILAFMRRNGSIHRMDSIEHCQCVNLPARIYDLRARGYVIDTNMVKNPNTGKRYALYRLKESHV